jgi:Zn finger protein HypA/HybF involved in hydrogenase expression
MKDNHLTKFYCKNCEHKWEGMFIPLYCPSCESVFGIAIDISEEEEK